MRASDVQDEKWGNEYCPVCGELVIGGRCSECGMRPEKWERMIELDSQRLQYEAECLDIIYKALEQDG